MGNLPEIKNLVSCILYLVKGDNIMLGVIYLIKIFIQWDDF